MQNKLIQILLHTHTLFYNIIKLYEWNTQVKQSQIKPTIII